GRRRVSGTRRPASPDRRPASSRRPAPRRARTARQRPLRSARSAWLLFGRAADDLVQSRLVDADVELVLEPRQVFADQVVRIGVLQHALDLLRGDGVGVERRIGDLRDAEHIALRVALADGAADGVLGGLEHVVDDRSGHVRRGLAALQVDRLLDLDAVLARDLIEARAAFDLGEHRVGLFLQRLRHLLVVPALLDLRLDLVELAIVRRRDAADVVIEEAAVRQLPRLVVDADIAREHRGQQVLREAEHHRHRLAVGAATGTVDGIDRERLQAELLRRLGQGGAAGALVLDLVAQVVDRGARARLGDGLLDLLLDVVEGLLRARVDLGDVEEQRAEAALDRLADLVERQPEGGFRRGRIDDLLLGHRPDVDVGRVQPPLLGDVGERL